MTADGHQADQVTRWDLYVNKEKCSVGMQRVPEADAVIANFLILRVPNTYPLGRYVKVLGQGHMVP